MKPLIRLSSLAFSLALTAPAEAQMFPLAQSAHTAPSIFAFPGKTCPGGSTPYKGPEQALAAETGAIYCTFSSTVVVLPKKKDGCPKPFYLEHKLDKAATKVTPADDVMWCDRDLNPQIPPPPPR